MQQHNHTQRVGVNGVVNSGSNAAYGYNHFGQAVSNMTTENTGGGNAQNLQPYQVTEFVIKF